MRCHSMAALVRDFDERFPELAPLLDFYSRLSAAPVPYGTLNTDSKKKKLYYEALLWLLRADLVVIAPVRVRLQIRKEVKERARVNLIETRKRLERELEVEKEPAHRRNLEELIDAMPDEAEFSILEQDVSVIASPIDCRGIVRPPYNVWLASTTTDLTGPRHPWPPRSAPGLKPCRTRSRRPTPTSSDGALLRSRLAFDPQSC
jgi:hypothetical protein